MRTYFASITGRSHVASGTPCQDRTFAVHYHGCHAMVMCDGAGSARKAHYGAAIVSKSVAYYVAEHFDSIFSEEYADIARQRILAVAMYKLNEVANEIGIGIRDLSTTLMCVAEKNGRLLVLHLGDGVILSMDKFGKVTPVSVPENGDACNETYFITSSGAERHLRMKKGVLRDQIGFLLMTDGAARGLYSKKEESKAVKKIFRYSMQAEELRISCKPIFDQALQCVSSLPGNTDDCSIGILLREDISPGILKSVYSA